VKKYVAKIRKVNPLYAGAVVLLLLVVLGVIVFASGGDDGADQKATTTATSTTKKKSTTRARKKKTKHSKPAPIGTSGTIDEARREGDFAVAQARGTIRSPSAVTVRVSAAPKQRVSVNWQLSCFKSRKVQIGKGQYLAKAPEERHIPLPMSGAETCIFTAGAQLRRHGSGRVKVGVVAG
jgi:hypothetical protein